MENNIQGLRTAVATQLVKLKIKNPLVFLGTQGVIAFLLWVVTDHELVSSLLGRMEFDPMNLPVEMKRTLTGSKVLLMALSGMVTSSTYSDLKEDHPVKQSATE